MRKTMKKTTTKLNKRNKNKVYYCMNCGEELTIWEADRYGEKETDLWCDSCLLPESEVALL